MVNKKQPLKKERVRSSADISRGKQAEDALRESEERVRYVLENVQDAVWSADLTGQYEFLSPLMAHIYGRPLEEMINNPAFWIEAVYPEDQAAARASDEALKRDGHIELEYRIVHPDGTVRWILDRKTLIRDAHGEPSRIAGIISDVTERKNIEEAQKKSEERLREVLANSIDAAYKRNLLTDAYDYFSPSFARISGYAPDEMNALPLETVENLMHPNDVAEVKSVIAKSMANPDSKPYQMEYRFKHKQGHYRWFQDRYTVMRDERGQPLALIGSVSDITERKSAEEALALSEEKFRLLVENSHDIIYTLTPEGVFTFVSPSWTTLLGHPVNQVAGNPFQPFVHPDDVPECMVWLQKVIETGQRQEGIDYRVRHMDGSWRWHTSSAVPLRDQAGIVIGFEGTASDITERKKAEEALAGSEERYRNILEQMHDSYFKVDLAGNFTLVNDATCRNLGYTVEELIGRNFTIIAPGEDVVKAIFEAYNKVYKTGEPYMGFTFKVIRKDGFVGYAEVSISVIKNEQGRPIGFRSVGRDHTERKQLEQKLMELATHDGLTGLANRALLYDRFGIAMANAQRNKKKIAVMTLDLDLFKYVNDTLGHDIGDRVLIAVAGRLTGALRKSDTVARMGGDEFVLLLWEVDDKDAAIIVAEKILKDFRQPFISDGHSLKVTISIGIAIYPEDGENMEELLKCSDKLLYTAKQNGGDKFAI